MHLPNKIYIQFNHYAKELILVETITNDPLKYKLPRMGILSNRGKLIKRYKNLYAFIFYTNLIAVPNDLQEELIKRKWL